MTSFLFPFKQVLLWYAVGMFAFQSVAMLSAADDGLDLNTVDTVKILLFSNERISNFQLFAQDGPITITNGTRSFTIANNAPGGRIVSNGSTVRFEHNKRNFSGRSLTIRTSEISLIRIRHPKTGIRYYRGSFSIEAKGGSLEVINTVNLEDYVGSVVGSEMNFEHPEALKVQAVIARTYALWNIDQNQYPGYDLTDHTMSQVYLGTLTQNPYYFEAAMATNGEILTWSDRLILAAYSSTCGGITNNNESVWSGKALPYLRSVNDHGACSESPHFRWTFSVEQWKLRQLAREMWHRAISDIRIDSTDQFGNVRTISLYKSAQSNHPLKQISGNTFRLAVLSKFGAKTLKSTTFSLQSKDGRYIFEGRGLGHGVGLCQWGALGLAESGWNYQDILKFYYTGVTIVDYHTLDQQTLKLAK